MKPITRYRINRFFKILFWGIMPVLSVVFVVYLIIIWREEYINKEGIQDEMSNVIRNGGSIDEIRHIFDTRSTSKMPITGPFTDFGDNNYSQSVSLSTILSDLLVKYYKEKTTASDSNYLERLQNIVTDYNAVHPFDGLEENQKYYLENIRQKLDSNYIFIQEDIVKVGDELDRKNQLVNKYLDKSEISFNISIFALFLTILFSVWQLIQNHRTGKKLDDLFSKNNQIEEKKETENIQEPELKQEPEN